MFQVNRLNTHIRADEGFSSTPYRCTSGRWTIGYGSTTYRDAPVHARSKPVSVGEARLMLRADILNAVEDCQHIYGDLFPALHSVHQEILICLAYQLGRKRLALFVKMNDAIDRFDGLGWVEELKDSRLYHQATRRIDRYVAAIEDPLTWS